MGVVLTFAGCDMLGTSDSPGQGMVHLQFKTVNSSSPAKAASNHDSLIVEGSNGTLVIDDIRFIVEEFELEREDDACEDNTAEGGDDCEEFESKPFFVDLPLNNDTLSLANDDIRPGLYEELEFEVKDLDFDEEGEDEDEGENEEDDAMHQALADSIRSIFPAWPDDASLVITGTFTPNDGEARSFKVFAEAEIEIEREFEPPLEVTDENMDQVVSVRINPSRWFEKSDGTVFDLSQYDWDENQMLLEFSAEFKDGVEEIEVDDDRDFDDDDGDDDDD